MISRTIALQFVFTQQLMVLHVGAPRAFYACGLPSETRRSTPAVHRRLGKQGPFGWGDPLCSSTESYVMLDEAGVTPFNACMHMPQCANAGSRDGINQI